VLDEREIAVRRLFGGDLDRLAHAGDRVQGPVEVHRCPPPLRFGLRRLQRYDTSFIVANLL
jgi:hypothetical protein